MWGFILLIIEILKLMVHFIIAGLKIWWGAMCWCFIFLANAFEELKTLSWQNEKDKPKIIKDAAILTLSVVAIIFLIWLLISIATGDFGSNSGRTVVSKPNKSYSQQETIDSNKETTQPTTTTKNYGWSIAPNNSNEFVYYDETGNIVKNKDYKIDSSWYYFDENGYMVKDKWHGDYYYGADGKMATNQWIGEYYVGSDGKYVQNTAPTSSSTQQETSLSISETTALNATSIAPTETQTIQSNEHINDYFYIDGILDTYTEEFDLEDNYSSKATIMIPKINGKDINKVNRVNEFLHSAKEELIGEAENLLTSGSPAYKTLSITNHEISSQSENRLRLILSGSLKSRAGSTKKVKVVFSYNADEDDYELEINN